MVALAHKFSGPHLGAALVESNDFLLCALCLTAARQRPSLRLRSRVLPDFHFPHPTPPRSPVRVVRAVPSNRIRPSRLDHDSPLLLRLCSLFQSSSLLTRVVFGQWVLGQLHATVV
jgi:hypothetical protein